MTDKDNLLAGIDVNGFSESMRVVAANLEVARKQIQSLQPTIDRIVATIRQFENSPNYNELVGSLKHIDEMLKAHFAFEESRKKQMEYITSGLSRHQK